MFSYLSVCPRGGGGGGRSALQEGDLPSDLEGVLPSEGGSTSKADPPPPNPRKDTTGNGQSVVGTHPTGMHSCGISCSETASTKPCLVPFTSSRALLMY